MLWSLLLLLILCAPARGTYRLLRTDDYRASYRFQEFQAGDPMTTDFNFDFDDPVAQQMGTENRDSPSIPAKDMVKNGEKVYLSLTTINSRQNDAFSTVANLLVGTVRPDHIYLFVSEDAYLFDDGITANMLHTNLVGLAAAHKDFFSIVFTNNVGPHRKLLPLLAHKWDENCVIITLDDESIADNPWTKTSRPSSIVERLLVYHGLVGGTDVISLRARRMGLCRTPPHKVTPYRYWFIGGERRREMLLMPTGTGGVLYRPQFFHPVIFDNRLIEVTKKTDDIMFRLSTMANGVYVTQSPRRFDKEKETSVAAPLPPIDGLWERNRAWRTMAKINDKEDGDGQSLPRPLIFPAHWGAPPARQTRDLVELPHSYGRGSGTLRKWVQEQMTKDWDYHELYGPREKYGMVDSYGPTPGKAALALATAGGGGSAEEGQAPRGRRALAEESLYAGNQHGGNDAAWKAATALLTKLDVLLIHRLTDNYGRRERFGCFASYWDAVQHHPDYRNASITGPPGGCCVIACGAKNKKV